MKEAQIKGVGAPTAFDRQGEELGLAEGYFLRENVLELPRSGLRLDQTFHQIRSSVIETRVKNDTSDSMGQKDYFKKNTEQILELIDYLAPAVDASDDFG